MSLKYPYRRLFFKGILRPKRLYDELLNLQAQIDAISGTEGSDLASTVEDLAARVEALENA